MNKRFKKYAVLFTAAVLSILVTACSGSREKYELRETAIRQMDEGDYKGAIETFGQALEKSDGFVGEFELDVLKYRGEAEYMLGDYAAAAHTYDVLCQADEERPEYLERLGMTYVLDGQIDQAIQAYQKLLEAEPDNQTADRILLLAGRQLTEAGRGSEAVALFQEAVNDGRESGAIYNQLALSEIETGGYDQALSYIQRGLSLQDGAKDDLLFNQAVAYEKKLDFSGALQSLTSYVQEFGSTPEVEKEIAFLKTRVN